MSYRWIGSILIVGSCFTFGCSIAVHQMREIHLLYALEIVIEDMLRELPYRLTPLPDLIRQESRNAPKLLDSLFIRFADNLDRQVHPDASCCMDSALTDVDITYLHIVRILQLLGASLGRFDLSGQLDSLNKVREECSHELSLLRNNQSTRAHSYRVLGLCSGIALAILLI